MCGWWVFLAPRWWVKEIRNEKRQAWHATSFSHTSTPATLQLRQQRELKNITFTNRETLLHSHRGGMVSFHKLGWQMSKLTSYYRTERHDTPLHIQMHIWLALINLLPLIITTIHFNYKTLWRASSLKWPDTENYSEWKILQRGSHCLLSFKRKETDNIESNDQQLVRRAVTQRHSLLEQADRHNVLLLKLLTP